jgi:hypothetical protein
VTFLAANSSSTVNDVEPGLLGFLVVAGLALALFFLMRSMNKQFHKIGPRPDDEVSAEAEEASEAAGQRPLRGLAAHRAAMAAAAKANADSAPEASDTASSNTASSNAASSNTAPSETASSDTGRG